jgi:hypothetical protein
MSCLGLVVGELDLIASPFEQSSVGHACRTNCLARSAPETLIQVMGEVVIDGSGAFGDLLHEKDASTRRIGLEMQHAVRRTRLLAQPAPRAAIEVH